MLVSTHIAVSGLVMMECGDPGAMVVINMALHPVLDAIPHAEGSTFWNKNPGRNQWYWAILITAVDYVLAYYIAQLVFASLALPMGVIILGLLAGSWMDVLHPLMLIAPLGERYRYWHTYTHSWPAPATEPIDWSKSLTERTPLQVKLLIQVVLTAVPIYVLVHGR